MTHESSMTVEILVMYHQTDHPSSVLVRTTVCLSSLSEAADAIRRAAPFVGAWTENPEPGMTFVLGERQPGEYDDGS